ncbi:GNAT family N-acetyltransferase [soil metagenome]
MAVASARPAAVSLEIRPLREDEFPAYSLRIEKAFGSVPTAEQIADWRSISELDRSLAVFDADDIVGAAGAFSFDLTVPGGVAVPVAGVTAVAVAPTHRRQGVLTSVMDRQLDDVAARGEAVAILTASETGIYGRFGYGLASFVAGVRIETGRSAFARPVEADGRLRSVEAAAATKVLPGVYDRWRSGRTGALSRSDTWWERIWRDREHDRDGASGLHCVVHLDDGGEPDGYATWRMRDTWTDHAIPENIVEIQELCALAGEVEAALWRFLLDIDLASEVRFRTAPTDASVRWRLIEPRRLQTTVVRDWLWVRLVDVAAALGLRRYDTDGSLVLDVADRFRPAQAGRYRLAVSGGVGVAERTDDRAEVALDVADLGAIYLGGVSVRDLAAAGRLQERAPGAIDRAERLFRTWPAPYCHTMF